GEPADRARFGGTAPAGTRARGPQRAQPLSRHRAWGRGRRLSRPRRDRRERPRARGRDHHEGGGRGARPEARSRRDRDREVDLGDGRAVIRRRLFTGGLVLAAALTFAFLLLPLAAIFLRVPVGELLDQLGSRVVVDAIVVTAKANGIAQGLILLVGTPAAYLIAGRRFRGRALAITLVELPLVLPPAVAGVGLLAAFGRLGLLGSTFSALGISISFTQTAVVLAVAYVASPFYLRQ